MRRLTPPTGGDQELMVVVEFPNIRICRPYVAGEAAAAGLYRYTTPTVLGGEAVS